MIILCFLLLLVVFLFIVDEDLLSAIGDSYFYYVNNDFLSTITSNAF